MAKPHIRPQDLARKTIDIHAHTGISLKSYASLEFPYCSSLEDIYYRQVANGVDCSVIFPVNANLYFDQDVYIATGKLVPAAKPLSPVPYGIENQMLLTEVYTFCPERSHHFLPFVSADPGRKVPEQVKHLRTLAQEFPIYGLKIVPVACQSPVAQLLDVGEPIMELAAEMGWPVLFHVTTHPGEQYSQACDTLRVVAKHPELRFCLAHCIGLHNDSIMRAIALPNAWIDTAALKIQVQLAHENNPVMALPAERFPCDCSNYVDVIKTLVARFPTRILWGSDAPYHSYIVRRMQSEGNYVDFRLKGTYEDEKAALDALTPAQRTRLHANALEYLFGL